MTTEGLALAERPTVAVVGAGFSGVLTALHLLRDPDGPRVRLIERRPHFARGTAYSTADDEHLLNVRASNMSAFPDDPDHFLRWLKAERPEVEARGFASRGLYGRYLQGLLRQAAETAAAGRLVLEADEAVRLSRNGAAWRVHMAMGRAFAADAVVLAVGNLKPGRPPGFTEAALRSPAYHADPWASDVDTIPAEGVVLLLGTGLTMVDAALRLTRERPALRLAALSRRGLLPRRHLGSGPAPEPFVPPEGAGARRALREFRSRARTQDWRCVVDGLRPHVQALWRGWPEAEKRRFLRHLRPWWDVHRHRLAPEVASKLDHLTASDRLTVAAGTLERVEAGADGGFEVVWSPRRGCASRRLEVAAVVNCTGPGGDLDHTAEPLLREAQTDGLVRADPLGLGFDVDGEGRLADAGGRPCATLVGVGPVTRAGFWEITSAPDIRVQAKATAAALIRTLSRLDA